MGWEVENRCQSRPWNQSSLIHPDNWSLFHPATNASI
jgi:hypothetical protein